MDKLEKLKQLLILTQNDTITPKQVQEFLTLVLNVVKKAKDNIDSVSQETKDTLNKALIYLEKEHNKLLETVSKETTSLDTKLTKKLEKSISDMRVMCDEMMMAKPMDGKDGENGLNGVDGKDGKDGSPDTGTEIVAKINGLNLNDENLIDAKHIKNLKGKVVQYAGTNGTSEARVRQIIAETPSTGGGHTIQDEGTPLTQRTNLNFVGAGVTTTDDAGNDATVVTIPSSSYTLPTASDTVLGGIKVGTNLSIDGNGVLSATGGSGTGDVTGPASSTDNAIVRFNSTTGKIIQNSTVTVADDGVIENANSVKFDITPSTITPVVGQLYWDIAENTLAINLDTTNGVTLSIGTEQYLRVVNKTGSTILDGKAVYINGAQGNRPTIALAKADAVNTSMLIGIATQNIADNAEGFITISGDVHGYDTSGFSAGDILYLSASTAGELTKIAPTSPNNVVLVATACNSTNNGQITVNLQKPLSADTGLTANSDLIAPTQKAVKTYIDTGLSGKQPTGSYEVTTNKENTTIDTSTTKYPTVNLLKTGLDLKIDKTQNTLTKEPTGFTDPANVIINYDPTTQTVTLTGTVVAYYQGVNIAVANPTFTSGWVSPAHPNVTGHTYFLYYNGTNFLWADNTFPGYDMVLISVVNYGATNKFANRECHGFMPWQAHKEFHETIGTYKTSGGTFPSASYTLNSTTAANRRPDVDQTIITDEDCPTTLAALTSKSYTLYNLTGASVGAYTLASGDIIPLSTNNPYYNTFSSPNWGQTLMPANSVASVWVYAIPVTASATSQEYRYLFIQPQWVTLATGASAGAIATAVASEKLRLPSELNLGSLALEEAELVCIGRIIIDYTTNWRLQDVSVVSGNKFSQIGSPSGNFLSTVVTDTTLTGGGTVASPLSAVSASTSLPGIVPAATAPASGLYNYIGITNGETAYSNKPLFDATSPTTQAFGDAAATGSATVAARRDHKHAMPANPVSGTLNEIAYFDSVSTVKSLTTATYPSLTELSYVKGATSSLQTQINAKGVGDMTLAGVQSVTGAKTFDKDKLLVKGTSTGTTNLTTANTSSTSYTATFPAKDGTVAMTTDIAPSIWTLMPGTPTRTANTTFTITGDYTSIIAKGMIIKWTESATVRCAMVAIPSTYSSPNTTVTICGDTMASIDASSLKYCILGAEQFIANFAIAGNIGATGTDVANVFNAQEPMRVLGADMYVGTAGTTNSTTVNIVNGTGTVTLASPTLGTTVRATTTPTVAASALSLALNDRVQVNVTAIQTTNAIDLYCKLYTFPTRLLNLS